jgi:biotin transporter BioY
MNIFAWIPRAIQWVAGFVTEEAPQSSARLIAVVAAVVCCGVAAGTVWFAFRHPEQTGTIAALASVITALGGLVGVALAVRKRNGDPEQ